MQKAKGRSIARFFLPYAFCLLPFAVFAQTITSSSFLAHIKILASDEFGGRGDGTEGLERAADYIASTFRDIGLTPAGENGTFNQAFVADVRVEPPVSSQLILHVGDRDERLTLGDQYYPISIIDRTQGEPAPALNHAPVVFAGFGIRAPAIGYDDYAGIDVNGKAVLVFTHEPQENDSRSPFEGKALTPGAAVAAKAREAAERGAVMLIVADDPTHHIEVAVSRTWFSDPQSEELPIPVVRVVRRRLTKAGIGLDLDRLGLLIDGNFKPQSQPVDGLSVSYTERRAHLRAPLRNIVGMIRGSDPEKAKEAIVIGAHYDHLGTGGRFSDAPEATGSTHNGADDNASGTAAMIETCRALAQAEERPARSIVCAAFAGEEIGLLGSSRYVANPPIDIARTTAMINLDMVGRAHGRVMMSVVNARPGMDFYRDLRPLTRLLLADFKNGGYAPGSSDDDSFIRRGVLTIAFFTGFHADYHRPSDDWQKIDAEGGARISELARQLTSRLAR